MPFYVSTALKSNSLKPSLVETKVLVKNTIKSLKGIDLDFRKVLKQANLRGKMNEDESFPLLSGQASYYKKTTKPEDSTSTILSSKEDFYNEGLASFCKLYRKKRNSYYNTGRTPYDRYFSDMNKNTLNFEYRKHSGIRILLRGDLLGALNCFFPQLSLVPSEANPKRPVLNQNFSNYNPSSVAVSSWTLVAISCERYYAICHPLRSRSWQTLRHAYKIIGFIWIGSLLCMLPIAGFSQLMPTSQGLRKCREQWPDEAIYYERAYNIFLDLILLVLPLVVLCAAYFLITRTLWKGIRTEKEPKKFAPFSISVATTLQQCQEDTETRQYESQVVQVYPTSGRSSCAPSPSVDIPGRKIHGRRNTSNGHKSSPAILRKQFDSTLRRTNVAKNLQNKQRVIKMLFVLVLEFFICWTPLYVINTIALFNPSMVYQNLGYTAISFFQLLAYSSSCCNPITYCFMNANFRRAFLDTFKGLKSKKRYSLKSAQDGELESPKVATNHS